MSKFSKQIQASFWLNRNFIPENFVPEKMFQCIQRFWIFRLGNHEEVHLNTNSDEMGIIILSGKCSIEIQDLQYSNLGSRRNVFEGRPTGFYIPMEEEFRIISRSDVELAICAGACKEKTQPALIQPENVKVMQIGQGNWQREVRIIIGENSPSVNLTIGECLNPPGNWSGTPPHKHEEANLPHESLHEELYYFKTDNPNGFGIQRLYSFERNINELILLKNNTITFMPWGYHQIVAGPGYNLYYLFFLSGRGKQLTGFVDPEHKWLLKGDMK